MATPPQPEYTYDRASRLAKQLIAIDRDYSPSSDPDGFMAAVEIMELSEADRRDVIAAVQKEILADEWLGKDLFAGQLPNIRTLLTDNFPKQVAGAGLKRKPRIKRPPRQESIASAAAARPSAGIAPTDAAKPQRKPHIVRKTAPDPVSPESVQPAPPPPGTGQQRTADGSGKSVRRLPARPLPPTPQQPWIASAAATRHPLGNPEPRKQSPTPTTAASTRTTSTPTRAPRRNVR